MMTYHRVIPRDLFNEADLLKSLGRLEIESDKLRALRYHIRLDCEEGIFDVCQNPDSGAIFAAGVRIMVRDGANETEWPHFRPLNARASHTLYVEHPETGETFRVLEEDGQIHPDFMRAIICKSKDPGACCGPRCDCWRQTRANCS